MSPDADSAPAPTPAEKELAAHWRSMTPTRMYDYGVPPDDVTRMQDLTGSGVAWDVSAERIAAAQVTRATDAAASAHPETAVQAYRAAVADLIFAQMAFNADVDRKRDLYGQVSAHLSSISRIVGEERFRKLELDFDGRALIGWQVRPPSVEIKGTVIVFGGQSGWGAAYWRNADALAERGLATILAEGPGQGETRLTQGVYLDVDVPAAYSRFVDHVHDSDDLGDKVGIFGNSMGGLWAALTAAADDRINACCINGAPARPGLLGHRSFDEQAAAMLGTDDLARVAENFERLTFDRQRHRIRCPLLVVHGGNDVLFNIEAQRPFLDSNGQDQTLRVWPDGDHTIYNHCEERSSYVADWFADRLT